MADLEEGKAINYSTLYSRLRKTLRSLMSAADDGEWHLAEDCRVEGRQEDCDLCHALATAQEELDSCEDLVRKWDEWHNGIPAPPTDLSDLPLFSPEEK